LAQGQVGCRRTIRFDKQPADRIGDGSRVALQVPVERNQVRVVVGENQPRKVASEENAASADERFDKPRAGGNEWKQLGQ